MSTSISFGYDGDEQRIRKTTPTMDTVYVGSLFEQVTSGNAKAYRYYVHSPERIVAIVTRGGNDSGTNYLHVDHLGSTDTISNAQGEVAEKRSYDPWGQRRNVHWGLPPPASFSSTTTKGFTGHDDEDDLGLVDMRGRWFDPRMGRFLSTDPIIANVHDGQTLNAFAYVGNNPLSYVDPSGFEREPFASIVTIDLTVIVELQVLGWINVAVRIEQQWHFSRTTGFGWCLQVPPRIGKSVPFHFSLQVPPFPRTWNPLRTTCN